MSTATQYNPNRDLNAKLLACGASKTVYALVNTGTERVKRAMFKDPMFMDMFRGAWTGRQDPLHEVFFDTWLEWSKPVVKMDRTGFPFYYPCNGASEPIRQIIMAAACGEDGYLNRIHFFEGEYEGYRAMAEAAGLEVVVHPRYDWHLCFDEEADNRVMDGDLFFISQPSAIDGMVWHDFNSFLKYMPRNSVVVDLTYVGAVPASSVRERFDMDHDSVRNVIFSLSKPFGVYYDRVGGVWCREEDLGLFGNRWFKNLTSLRLGTDLMREYGVFHIPNAHAYAQQSAVKQVSEALGYDFKPADVFILALADVDVMKCQNIAMTQYLTRAEKLRVCLTPAMAAMAGTLPEFELMLSEDEQ